MTLDFAATAGYEPGTNRRGEQADTTWLFLLGRLDMTQVVTLGVPAYGTLMALAALAREVAVEQRGIGDRLRLKRVGSMRGCANVRAGQLEAGGPADLVYVTADHVRRLAADAAKLEGLRDRLSADGVIYLEQSAAASRVAEALGSGTIVALTPLGPDDRGGRLHEVADTPKAVPITTWLLPAPFVTPSPMRRALLRLLRLIARKPSSPAGGAHAARPLAVTTTGRAGEARADRGPAEATTILMTGRARSPGTLPEYVLDAAREGGYPLDAHRWTLAPPRGYRSQKVIFFVSSDDGGPADAVVKLTQDPQFNSRLDNEFHALRTLEERGLAELSGAPRALFRGEHAKLSVVGETSVAGVGFRECSTGKLDCPRARSAIDAIIALGAASARVGELDGIPLERSLSTLLDSYGRVYEPTPRTARVLGRDVKALVEAENDLPMVFQHGDPTTLNLLVGEDGRIGMVDWENADPAAPPLWDLFYFLWSFTSWVAGLRGKRIAPLTRLDPASPFAGLYTIAVDSYRRRVAIPEPLVEPLLRTCWMYLALRQARQLSPRALGRGTYARALELALGASATRQRTSKRPWSMGETG